MESYRSLHAWQRAHAIAVAVLRIADREYHPKSRAILDQLRRAAVSIEANVVEGYALRAPLQFRRHLRIALGSAAETECLLRLAEEVGYLPEPAVTDALVHTGSVIGILVGMLRKPVSR